MTKIKKVETRVDKSELILSAAAVQVIRQNPKLRTQLSLRLKVNDADILDWVEQNTPYSKLTNVGAIDLLQRETMLSPNEILIEK